MVQCSRRTIICSLAKNIYREYRNLMLYVANGILGDQTDSEDVVHQSFLKLIKVLHKIEEP